LSVHRSSRRSRLTSSRDPLYPSPIAPSTLPFLFFPYPPTTQLYTLSLHDALPISRGRQPPARLLLDLGLRAHGTPRRRRRLRGEIEEHTSELQSPDHLVCRLLLEKKNER